MIVRKGWSNAVANHFLERQFQALRRCYGVLMAALDCRSAAMRSARRLIGLVLALFALMPALSAHAGGGTWYYDGTGRAIPSCAKPFTGGDYVSVVTQWFQCEADSVTSGTETFVVSNCFGTSGTATSFGVGQCHAVFSYFYPDGTFCCTTQTDQAAQECPDATFFVDPPPYGGPACIRVGDIFHIQPIRKPCLVCGDPIYPLTGARRQDEDLGIRLAGRPILLTYDTQPALPVAQGLVNWTFLPPPSFGSLWQSSLHKKVVQEFGGGPPTGDYSSVVMLRGSMGLSTASGPDVNSCDIGGGGQLGTESFRSTVDPALALTALSAGEMILVDAASMIEENYGDTGSISRATFATGGILTYTYSTAAVPGVAPAAGLLTSVTDHFGRTVQFTYEQPDAQYLPRIKTVIAPDGAVTQATYDVRNNLTSLIWPDTYLRQYRYERSDLPGTLTGITDESNQNYASYGYDSAGRASSTKLGSGVDSYTVAYGAPPTWEVTEIRISPSLICRDHHWIAPQATTVIDPTGTSRAFGATTANGMTMLASTTSPAGSGSSASSTQTTYDANANITSQVDLNGNLHCYAYDTTRNLQTLALEGLPASKTCPTSLVSYIPGPVDAAHPERKTTTVWHPDWELKAQEAAPKKITTWVYNGQPDPIAGTTASCVAPAATLPDGKPLAVLCVRYEQGTTDTTGAQGLSATVSGATRAWTYTYNQFGQVLTETTPKQSSTDTLSHTTTYTYYPTTSFSGAAGYTMGDLQSVSNPLGQVTNYTSYDKAGRLLSSTDANGTVTTQTYFPRGWLQTQTVTPATGGALTTTYAYWPTGLLKSVTLPDASTLNYAYDGAHRLTDVTDAAGNKLHYVLDNSGNRTSEQVSDASGQLASTVTRVFDALNRVQLQTGAN